LLPFGQACLATEIDGADFDLDVPVLTWDSTNWNAPGDTTYFDPATDTVTLRIWGNDQDPLVDPPAMEYEVPVNSDLLLDAPFAGAPGAPPPDRIYAANGEIGLKWPGFDDSSFDPDVGLTGVIYPGAEFRPIQLLLNFNPSTELQELAYPNATVNCEPGGTLAIDKKAFDPVSGLFTDIANLPSSTTFPTTVEWQITVTNVSQWLVENVHLTDPNAAACETEFAAAMDAVEAGKTFLEAFESVTFTCESDIGGVPALNTAIAGATDVWGRPLPEVSDDAAVVQVLASGIIGDTVWYDTNGNGVQDGSEQGIQNTKVVLNALDGQDVDPLTAGIQTSMTATTGIDGKYLFSGLPDGRYRVQVSLGDVPNPSAMALRFTTASSFTIDLPEGGSILTADFGVVADELPTTGVDTDVILLIAILLMVAGSVAVLVARRRDELGGEAEAG
ncbi:MAG: LPXTG cell wall anchor domain-containing protein, partial [Acidimicrobiia bacterium]|nr:LPXTG cell wall anchor domain-containing protein [Acidimicrobiia bacterium]